MTKGSHDHTWTPQEVQPLRRSSPTFSPASLLRVLFMISSRRWADQIRLNVSCGTTFKSSIRRSRAALTLFLSSRSCSSFWKCFSRSRRWRSDSSRVLASASSLWNKKKLEAYLKDFSRWEWVSSSAVLSPACRGQHELSRDGKSRISSFRRSFSASQTVSFQRMFV